MITLVMVVVFNANKFSVHNDVKENRTRFILKGMNGSIKAAICVSWWKLEKKGIGRHWRRDTDGLSTAELQPNVRCSSVSHETSDRERPAHLCDVIYKPLFMFKAAWGKFG